MQNHAVFRAAGCLFNAPLLRRGLDKHVPCRRTGFPHGIPGRAHTRAAARALHTERGIEIFLGRGSEFGANLLPIALQLFGRNHTKRRLDALAHFRLVDDDGYGIVGANAHPRVQCRRLRCPGGRRRERFIASRQITSEHPAGRPRHSGFEEAPAIHAASAGSAWSPPESCRAGPHAAPPTSTVSTASACSSLSSAPPFAAFAGAPCNFAARWTA